MVFFLNMDLPLTSMHLGDFFPAMPSPLPRNEIQVLIPNYLANPSNCVQPAGPLALVEQFQVAGMLVVIILCMRGHCHS